MTTPASKMQCQAITKNKKGCLRQAFTGQQFCWQHLNDSWRKFEQLVAIIEKHLAPTGAIVKSPDKIRDKVTGRMREVDASIRYQDDSVSKLVTIECRERSRVQDDTWIEQLVTKRDKIGAHQTIAVSSSWFTESAILSAQHYGIELRRIDEITDSTIVGWVEGFAIDKVTLYDSIVRYTIDVKEDDVRLSKEIEKITEENPFDGHILFRYEDNLGLSINALLNNFYKWQSEGLLGQDSFIGITGTDDLIGRRITINFAPGFLYTFMISGKSDVLRVTIDLHTRIEREAVPLPKVHRYSDTEKVITQIAVGTMVVEEEPKQEYQIFLTPQPIENL